jgi:hypothetical protein
MNAGSATRGRCSSFFAHERGRRPIYGGLEKFQTDPHWRDLPLFHEHFQEATEQGRGPFIRPIGRDRSGSSPRFTVPLIQEDA